MEKIVDTKVKDVYSSFAAVIKLYIRLFRNSVVRTIKDCLVYTYYADAYFRYAKSNLVHRKQKNVHHMLNVFMWTDWSFREWWFTSCRYVIDLFVVCNFLQRIHFLHFYDNSSIIKYISICWLKHSDIDPKLYHILLWGIASASTFYQIFSLIVLVSRENYDCYCYHFLYSRLQDG